MPVLQLYAVQPLARAFDPLMRYIVEFMNRAALCVTAFLASASVLGPGAQTALGVQPVAAQYLLGLGECFMHLFIRADCVLVVRRGVMRDAGGVEGRTCAVWAKRGVMGGNERDGEKALQLRCMGASNIRGASGLARMVRAAVCRTRQLELECRCLGRTCARSKVEGTRPSARVHVPVPVCERASVRKDRGLCTAEPSRDQPSWQPVSFPFDSRFYSTLEDLCRESGPTP